MITFHDIRSHIVSTYGAEQSESDQHSVSLEISTTKDGRRQRVTLSEVQAADGDRYLAISTTIAALADLDPVECLRFNKKIVRGYLAVTNLGDEAYVIMCATLPLSTLDLDQLERCITAIALSADRLEADFTGGGDVF